MDFLGVVPYNGEPESSLPHLASYSIIAAPSGHKWELQLTQMEAHWGRKHAALCSFHEHFQRRTRQLIMVAKATFFKPAAKTFYIK